ncbi:MAG: gamma-glutamyltransferase [Candidatus Sericytochromatia bacterium]|nr:MAG: gamma-glutamyltransferase [Candidatus Sericytochromatia bacterium]
MLKKISLTISLFFVVNLKVKSAVREPVSYKNGIVVSDNYLASMAGKDVLKNGGNAIDAAVATSLVLSVVRNQSTGIGGGGFMIIRTSKGEDIVIDYREVAPKKAYREMYLDKNGNVIPNLSTVGYKSIAVPGLLSGLDYALKNYGTKSFKELSSYAIKYAENGFKVDKHFVVASETLYKRGYTKDLANTFFSNGKPKKIGDIQKNIDLAKTLKIISEKGISEFYNGSIADKIEKAMKINGGLITKEDLKNYKPKIRKALKGSYRNYEIITMPPPSSGGIVLLEILNILENYNISWNSIGYGSEFLHILAEAMKHAYSDRAEYLGDTDFVNVPINQLISKEYAKKLKINIEKTMENNFYGKKYLNDDSGTTHFCIADKYGNIVSATETINTYFGSQVIIPETGILMNNEMDDFSSSPGKPNAFGLIGNENNSIQPLKKPLSSMTPTIILKDNKPFMAVGASGGPRIITGTLQTIINVIDFGMNIEEAVSFSRIHHQWFPNKLFVEKEIPIDVINNLKAKGHEVVISSGESAVQAILIKNNIFTGASDPRKGGMPDGY